MKNVLKLKDSSKPAESKLENDVLELYMDYIGDDGYVYKHNGKEYYRTNISLQGPKGNPGPKGRDGYTPNIGLNGNWYIGGKDTLVKAALNTDEYVTKDELEDVIGNAPETLDTLKELADSLGNDANFAINVNNSINELKENLTFTETTDPANGHEYVDLGLPSGTKWATMNVGASSETDYGNYYQYGKGAAQYTATSGDRNYIGAEDPLNSSVDTAAQVWGGLWHMPTKTQMQELIANTTYEWTTINGVNGGKFTATNGNYVFFPAAGYWSDGSQNRVGTYGRCWTSSPLSNSFANAYYLNLNNDSKSLKNYDRKLGYSVRGVLDATEVEPITTTYTANRVVIPIDSSKNAAVSEGVINIHTAVPYITDTENYLIVLESENLHSGTVIVEANLSGKGLCCPANIIRKQDRYYIYPSLPLDNIKDNLKNLILYCYLIEDYVGSRIAHKLWFDDFPEDKLDDIINTRGFDNWEDFVADLVENVNEDTTGANGFIYTGETFNWNGNEYYLWETDTVVGNIPYIITDTVNYNELYPNSLEADSSNKYCPYVAMLTDDMETLYTRADERGDILIKVEPEE